MSGELAAVRGLGRFQERLGYRFHDEELLARAFVHRSFLNECADKNLESNERLEFLGDAVLELIVSDYLFHKHPDMPEGQLTKKRSQAVCEASFAYLANRLGLGEYLLLGRGEEASGGRSRASLLADCFEALCGAIYLDGGYPWLVDGCAGGIDEFLAMEKAEEKLFVDYKSRLQELLHRKGAEFEYRVIGESGPDHAKEFTVALYIDGSEAGRSKGTNKKKAQQEVARTVYLELSGK